jgi:CDGSH-type Zn-finger protein
MTEQHDEKSAIPRIVMTPNGSYHVYGNIPLVHKTQVVSEYGEPLTWVKDGVYDPKPKEGQDYYRLCRCGQSKDKPYCDSSHHDVHFDGTQTADTRPTAERREIHPGTGLVVKHDDYLCADTGFCGTRLTNILRMLRDTGEPRTRAEIIAMIERCPSGSYAYSMAPDQEDIEPDLPMQIAVTTEMTSDGPIEGPLWVTGNIPIERADGQPFETRNRVTLCNCGLSKHKPLCDGAHRSIRQTELRQAKAEGG